MKINTDWIKLYTKFTKQTLTWQTQTITWKKHCCLLSFCAGTFLLLHKMPPLKAPPLILQTNKTGRFPISAPPNIIQPTETRISRSAWPRLPRLPPSPEEKGNPWQVCTGFLWYVPHMSNTLALTQHTRRAGRIAMPQPRSDCWILAKSFGLTR